jgi:hypothetical protein
MFVVLLLSLWKTSEEKLQWLQPWVIGWRYVDSIVISDIAVWKVEICTESIGDAGVMPRAWETKLASDRPKTSAKVKKWVSMSAGHQEHQNIAKIKTWNDKKKEQTENIQHLSITIPSPIKMVSMMTAYSVICCGAQLWDQPVSIVPVSKRDSKRGGGGTCVCTNIVILARKQF